MDTSEMQELLRGYLNEMDMTAGLSKDAILENLAGRDEALRTMVNEFLPEGTYQGTEEVMDLIPAQAWQDAQGDNWRGAETQYVENTNSNYQEGPLGGSSPSTGGTKAVGGASGGSSGGGATGEAGGNAGEVDPGVGGESEITGES